MKTLDDYIYTSALEYLCEMEPVDRAINEKQNDILIHVKQEHHWEPFEHWDSDGLCAQIRQNAEAFYRLAQDT